jgi:hypothetical protein
MYGKRANELVDFLGDSKHSTDLGDLVQDFCQVAQSQLLTKKIHCFYETLPTHVVGAEQPDAVLVDQFSASLPISIGCFGLNARHSMLNKFRGPEDESYRMVAFSLEQLATSAMQRG